MVSTWWVNQKDREFDDIWAKEDSKDGRRVPARERVQEAQPNDLIFHNHQHHVVAISRVASAAFWQPRPQGNGYKLPITCEPLDQPLALRHVSPEDMPTGSGTPFQAGTNHPKVGYCFPVPEELAELLFHELGMDRVDLHADTPTGVSITIAGHTDADVIATMRREQPALRRYLLGGRTEAPCALCGRVLPSAYLVASHIKRRADCTEAERRDPNVGMLSCVLGCDAAFELGHVYVDQEGRLRVREWAPRIIRDFFAPYGDRTVAIHTAATAPYFKHREVSNDQVAA